MKIFLSKCLHSEEHPGQFSAVFPQILNGRAEAFYSGWENQRTNYKEVWPRRRVGLRTPLCYAHITAIASKPRAVKEVIKVDSGLAICSHWELVRLHNRTMENDVLALSQAQVSRRDSVKSRRVTNAATGLCSTMSKSACKKPTFQWPNMAPRSSFRLD
ncbi:hypothetical protein K470DRAFT_47470 [Piedraia hortae CBS 480.64]|uniref:Uncharacterized protein n=1 Tax=Piedraia hortae CBS 480.64 TaxID=1314780 RepID=A0A6A7C8U8_9PEZI|nr:hypothetical protein K470DRAFT_47470 [Piedraia hortae CBS 480.64]